MSNTGFIFKGSTISDVLKKVWQSIKKHGTSHQSQSGLVNSIRGVTLVINNPLDEKNNYPYWNKLEDDWYQDNFVKKETNSPPEVLIKNSDIYQYKYVWRSRYYDLGYGHIKGVVNALKQFSISNFQFSIKKQLIDLLKKSYQFIHPEIVLAVLAWKGKKLINYYLKNPSILDQELKSNRTDILLSIISELKQNPSSRRAITPSLLYSAIDQQGSSGGIPVYQNYQLYINFSKSGKPESLTSFHLHRAFDAYGGLQLDINHDKDWGKIASKKLGLPLKQMVIYGNDVWASEDHKKEDIKSWLLAATNSYDPKVEDIEKRLSSESFKKKIEYTLKNY